VTGTGALEHPRRASKRFAEFDSLEEMLAAVNDAYNTPIEERRFSRDEQFRSRFGELPLYDLDAYTRRLQNRAFYFLGATSAADRLHEWLGDPMLPLPIPEQIASLPAVSGAGASSAFDRFMEHPTRNQRAMDQAWRRLVDPPAPQTFLFLQAIDSA
jgi:hypothetical protein